MTSKHDGGKGDMPRPIGVDQKEFDERWDAIFNNPPPPPKDPYAWFDLEADNDHVEILATIPFGK